MPRRLLASAAQGIVEAVHLDGSTLVLELVNFEFRLPPSCASAQPCPRILVTTMQLHACSIDSGVDGCALRAVSPSGPFDSWHGVALSGHRLAWAFAQLGEESAIFFCELRDDLECPVQHVSGSLAPQVRPAMDGHRLAWEDRGESSVVIQGIELPRIFAPRHVRVRAGKTFRFLVRGGAGSASDGKLELDRISGVSPLAAGVKIRRVGSVFGPWFLVQGRIPKQSAEVSQWRARFITSGGLVAEAELALRQKLVGHSSTTVDNEKSSLFRREPG